MASTSFGVIVMVIIIQTACRSWRRWRLPTNAKQRPLESAVIREIVVRFYHCEIRASSQIGGGTEQQKQQQTGMSAAFATTTTPPVAWRHLIWPLLAGQPRLGIWRESVSAFNQYLANDYRLIRPGSRRVLSVQGSGGSSVGTTFLPFRPKLPENHLHSLSVPSATRC
jgi:hypothetical protein